MDLVIERKKWLRGEGQDESYLLRKDDGKMCCLGFFGLACGLTEEDILNKQTLASVTRSSELLGGIMRGFVTPVSFRNTDDCGELMEINDDIGDDSMTKEEIEAQREKTLTEKFKNLGVNITFVD